MRRWTAVTLLTNLEGYMEDRKLDAGKSVSDLVAALEEDIVKEARERSSKESTKPKPKETVKKSEPVVNLGNPSI